MWRKQVWEICLLPRSDFRGEENELFPSSGVCSPSHLPAGEGAAAVSRGSHSPLPPSLPEGIAAASD